MTITTRDQLLDAMANDSTSLVVNKASMSAQLVGGFSSLWRATGIPGQGAIPTTAIVYDNTNLGCFTFPTPDDPVKTYLARMFLVSTITATDVQIHDRLTAMGGLAGNLATVQTVNVDASVVMNNLELRRGDTNYSDVQWWIEWYTATGTTAATATLGVTYDNDMTGTATVYIAASTGAARMLAIQSAVAGRFIKSIQTLKLSVSTGTLGNIGITASRALCGVSLGLAAAGTVADWQYLGIPRIHDQACLAMVMIPGATSTGTLYGSGKLAQG